eukprot:m.444195 g.444195  ORF g.444195 m.444195 type:complete len:89 (+) comp20296_c10_seq1:126-392(+)
MATAAAINTCTWGDNMLARCVWWGPAQDLEASLQHRNLLVRDCARSQSFLLFWRQTVGQVDGDTQLTSLTHHALTTRLTQPFSFFFSV